MSDRGPRGRGREALVAVLAIGALGAGSQTSAGPSSTLPTVSGVIAVTMPPIAITARLSGTVELKLTTNGETVDRVDVIRPAQFLSDGATSFVRGWHFADAAARTFNMTITLATLADCAPRITMAVDIEAPSRASVTAGEPCVILVEGPGPRDEIIGPLLVGRVRCECQEHFPIADAIVTLSPDKGGPALRTNTTSDGTYSFTEIPYGDYRLRFDAEGFRSSGLTQTLRVRGGRQTRPSAVTTLAPNSLVVRAVDFPIYPAEALERNLEGTVHIRVAGRASRILDGDRLLAASALANVMSWHITGGSGTPIVTYTYSLTDGDCQNPNPRVTMKLPFEVTIVGKRRTGCRSEGFPSVLPAYHLHVMTPAGLFTAPRPPVAPR